MKPRILVTAAAAAILVLGLSACAPQISPYGAWGSPDSQDEPGLLLNEDGTFSGNDGCNRLMGSFEVQDNIITFGPIASTLMFCDGVDAWLGEAVTGTVSADELTLIGQDGDTIGTLMRSADS